MGPKARRSKLTTNEDSADSSPRRGRNLRGSQDEQTAEYTTTASRSRKSGSSVNVDAPVSPFNSELSQSSMFEDNLTLEACRDKLCALQQRNDELEKHAAFVRSDVRMNLESQLEEFRTRMEDAIYAVSESIVKQTEHVSLASTRQKGPRPLYPRKVFKPQESPLSKMLLYDEENYKTLFNIGVVCLVLWAAAMVLDDIDRFGTPNFDLLMWGVVNDFEQYFKQWFILIAMSFTVVPLAHIWAESKRAITSLLLGAVYVSWQIWMFTFSAKVVFANFDQLSMPLAMGFMVL